MTRLTVLCFAGTYALALLSEWTRLLGRALPWRLLPATLLGLGWVVQSLYIANLAIQAHGLPIATAFESLLMLGWILAAIAFYLELHALRERSNAAGPLVLALALVVLTVAGIWAPREGTTANWTNALTFWGTLHGVFQTLGAVGTSLAFTFGLMYLAQSRRLKRKKPAGWGLPLPSLEQSDRWHRSAIILAFPLLTAGLLTGVALVAAVHRGGSSTFRWSDPKVVSTFALWFVTAALLVARFRPDWQGRRLMILTVLAFVVLAFTIVGVGLVLPTAHGGLSVLLSTNVGAP